MNPGYIYVLSNPALQGMVKIGRSSKSVRCRARSLSKCSLPYDFDVEFFIYVPNASGVESKVHQSLRQSRIVATREFFTVTADSAAMAITDVAMKMYSSKQIQAARDKHAAQIKANRQSKREQLRIVTEAIRSRSAK